MSQQTYTIQEAGYAELHCRDTGHQWDSNRKLGKRAPTWGTRRSLECGSCGSWRHEIVNSHGEIDLTSRSYDLTIEYHFACEFERMECRAELMRRDRVHARELASGGITELQAARLPERPRPRRVAQRHAVSV